MQRADAFVVTEISVYRSSLKDVTKFKRLIILLTFCGIQDEISQLDLA